MNPPRTPHELACDLVKQHPDPKALSEADTRHRIIDAILHDVLSWPRAAMVCEPYIDPGYADYVLTGAAESQLLFIEAKRSVRSREAVPALIKSLAPSVLWLACEVHFTPYYLYIIGYSKSLGADAVEPSGIINPRRIAEIERVAGEGVGLQRKPDGISEVRASLDHYDHAAGPGNIESKLIGPHTKVAITGLHLRLP